MATGFTERSYRADLLDTLTEAKVELAVEWRAHDPVQLAVGPVLHSGDAAASKACALFGRALPRDFLDVGAAIMSGRYTRERLLESPQEPTAASAGCCSPTRPGR